jgi:hypothetical protein
MDQEDEEKSAPFLDGWHAHRLEFGPVEAANPYSEHTQAKSHALWQSGYCRRFGAVKHGEDTSSRDNLY